MTDSRQGTCSPSSLRMSAAVPPEPRSPRLFPGQARVTVVEATDEDPAALREAHVIITGPRAR